MDRAQLLVIEGRVTRERSSSTSACLSSRGSKPLLADIDKKSSYGDIPHYNMKMIAFMGKSLQNSSMKQWKEESEKALSERAHVCSFLVEEEKEMAKGVTPRFFSHLKSDLPENYCLCKADSVANLSKWEPYGVGIESKKGTFLTDVHVPNLEELKGFADSFVLPTDWTSKKRRKPVTHDDEMDVYQLRLAERDQELTKPQRADQVAHLKQTLGVNDKGNSNARKRRNSVFKLFGKASGPPLKEKEEGQTEETPSDYCEIVDEKGIKQIKYGTLGNVLSNIIQFLTMHQNPPQKAAGNQMMIAFVHAYARVTTSSEILQWLQTSYFAALEETEQEAAEAAEREGSEGGAGERRASIIQATKADTIIQGILLFLVRWLGHRFVPDFTSPYVEGQSRKTPLYGELLQFIGRMPPGHRNNVKNVLDQESSEGVGVQHSASKLLGLSRIGAKFQGDDGNSPKAAKKEKKKEKMQRNSSLFFTVMNHRSQKLPPRFTLLDLMAEEVSELLTAEDSRLFSNVAVDEFGGKAWTPKLDSGIGVMTHRWNKLGRWAASELVNTKSLKQRVEILKRMINILDELFKANNFFTTMALISGLNHSAVQRLKKTWKALPEKYKIDLLHLEDELSFSQSFRRYRELLADAVEQDKPCIPFLAVHTKDMLFITEAKGNPEWISPNVMNFEKIVLIGNIVSQMKACQKNQSKYQVMILNHSRTETIKNFIGRLPNTLPEESLYPCSVENEPRDS